LSCDEHVSGGADNHDRHHHELENDQYQEKSMSETINHQNLSSHSAPFSVAGGRYAINAQGTIAIGGSIELQRLVNGGFVPVDPPARFLTGQSGGTSVAVLAPGQVHRWTLIGNGHLVNTSVAS
jgi:hypothetical protein